MSKQSKKFTNSLLGTLYKNGEYFIEAYNINKNFIQKELIDDTLALKEDYNIINESTNNNAFCYDCQKNINLNVDFDCKTHNTKKFNDLVNDINIKELEEKLNQTIENFENVMNIIEEKINKFKKRNINQILLAKKVLELYKTNINNLNYQILLNTKNILNFNEIKGILEEPFRQDYLIINMEFNILKEFQVNNYIKENISIDKIQNNLIMKFGDNSNKKINSVIILKKQKKLLFNIGTHIYMINTQKYITEDNINSKKKIILMNLMNDNKTILLSHLHSISILQIENNKLKLKDFIGDIRIESPGIIINYNDEYAWTCRDFICFLSDKEFCITIKFYDDLLYVKKINLYDYQLLNLYQYKHDILFTFSSFERDIHEKQRYAIRFGACNEKLKFSDFLYLEDCDYFFDFYKYINYRNYSLNSDEIIITGNFYLNIIDLFHWNNKSRISLSGKLINNSLYLSYYGYFITFLNKKISNKNEDFNLYIKTIKNNDSIIFKTLFNFEKGRIYCYKND